MSCGNQIMSVQLKFSCDQYLQGICSKNAITYEFLKCHSSANKTDHIQKCLRQKVINTLILRTSLWLRCWHCTWVADGTCQTSTLLNIDIKRLFHRDTKVCILEKKTWVSSLLSQDVTAYFTSTSFVICQVLLKVSQETEIAGHHTASRSWEWLSCYGWRS